MTSNSQDSAWPPCPRICLCGCTGHVYTDCYALNPYTRKSGFKMNRRTINKINKHLDNDPKLREEILKLGYDFYVHRFKEPANENAQLAKLPAELKIQILELTYAISLDELPESHPRVDGKQRAAHRSNRDAPVPTILNLPVQPLKDGSSREQWLREHRGNWGPFFQIMYVSKDFYHKAKPIRYREVHIRCVSPFPVRSQRYDQSGYDVQDSLLRCDLDLVCSRLSMIKVLKEQTKHVKLTVDLAQLSQRKIMNFVKALATLPRLRHLAINLTGYTRHWRPHIAGCENCSNLLHFFDLNLETLTFIWSWNCYQQHTWGGYRQEDDPNTDVYAHVNKHGFAEEQMQEIRNRFITQTYEPSKWYSNTTNDGGPVLGKTEAIYDWTIQKVYKPDYYRCSHWNMDTFMFNTTGRRTSPPLWNINFNPWNHSDQLNEEELKASRPVPAWRNGWKPLKDSA